MKDYGMSIKLAKQNSLTVINNKPEIRFRV